MVQTRSRATSPGHQESRDALCNPHHDRQSAPVMQRSSVQHVQSMAAAMAELTHQNQELTREINSRRENPMEDLVHKTNSPFTASINGHPLPPKFKMPSLDSYDGMHDPFDHIATFKTTMHLQGFQMR